MKLIIFILFNTIISYVLIFLVNILNNFYNFTKKKQLFCNLHSHAVSCCYKSLEFCMLDILYENLYMIFYN